MAFVATLTKATPNRLVYLCSTAGDAGGTIANATLLANAVAGPLKNALAASYVNQAAMQAVIGGGNVEMRVNPRTGAGLTIWAAEVDTDAVTPAHPEVNVVSPILPNPSTAYLVLEYQHTVTR